MKTETPIDPTKHVTDRFCATCGRAFRDSFWTNGPVNCMDCFNNAPQVSMEPYLQSVIYEQEGRALLKAVRALAPYHRPHPDTDQPCEACHWIERLSL